MFFFVVGKAYFTFEGHHNDRSEICCSWLATYLGVMNRTLVFKLSPCEDRCLELSYVSVGFTDLHLSNEKHPGWLGYIGEYTTQLYREYNKPL